MLPALAAAALLALAGSSAASAQNFDSESIVVPFADLDLPSHAGRARLDTRLKVAAFKVCDTRTRDLRGQRLDGECRKRALNGARTEVASLLRSSGGRTEVALRR
jgi:UrcA family protein